jgi:hypothetical protein
VAASVAQDPPSNCCGIVRTNPLQQLVIVRFPFLNTALISRFGGKKWGKKISQMNIKKKKYSQ